MIISPRVACLLAVFLALVMVLDVGYRAMYRREFVPTQIDCAAVLTHETQVCR